MNRERESKPTTVSSSSSEQNDPQQQEQEQQQQPHKVVEKGVGSLLEEEFSPRRPVSGRRVVLQQQYYKDTGCTHWECGIMECIYNKIPKIEQDEMESLNMDPMTEEAISTVRKEKETATSENNNQCFPCSSGSGSSNRRTPQQQQSSPTSFPSSLPFEMDDEYDQEDESNHGLNMKMSSIASIEQAMSKAATAATEHPEQVQESLQEIQKAAETAFAKAGITMRGGLRPSVTNNGDPSGHLGGGSSEFFKDHVSKRTITDNTGNLGIYTGAIDRRSGKPHGVGMMVYQDGGVSYDGQWVQGDWCGFGKLSDSSRAGPDGEGDVYQGGFFDNMKHGLGVMKYADGRVYDGTFQFDKLEGKGHMTNVKENTKYWGYWDPDGIPHGRGKIEYADGRIFDGEFDKGVISGHGRMTFPDGKWYLGEWSDGEPNGLGMEAEADGSLLFEGMYCHGKPIQASSFPHTQKSSGQFLLYRSSVACRGTLVGPLPRQVVMKKKTMNFYI